MGPVEAEHLGREAMVSYVALCLQAGEQRVEKKLLAWCILKDIPFMT